ncbi:MAG: VWA domain-containing protein, partial [Deltaproteobacteria bacterium]
MSGLSLMHARGLWLLLGVLPVVLLYILKTKRTRVRVSSTWLWLGGQKDLQARSPWKKLTREMTLLFELLALAALALALGAPACRGRSIVGQHVAIVVDLSASMQTVDDRTRRARIAEARDAARRLVDGLAAGSDAMLVGAGRDARVLFALGRDRNALRAAIDRAIAQEVEGDLASGVTLAIDRLRPLAGDRRVFVVTDGATARLETLRTGPIPMQLVRVGHAQDNAAIVRMDVRSARQGREGETVQAFALVANHGETARDVYVTARREGDTEIVASRRLTIEPHHREPVLLSFPAQASDVGRGLVVDLAPHDALAADDVAYGRIPPGAQLPVVLVSRAESPWIHRALTSDPFATLTSLSPDATEPPPADALVVYDGLCPAALPARNDVLVFAPPPGRCADVTVEGSVAAPYITSYANTDPRFRFLTMDGVHLASATPLRLG